MSTAFEMSKSHQQVSRVPFSQIGRPTTWLVRSLSASALSLEISFPFVSRLVAVAPIGESNKSTGCQNDVELKMSLSNDFHNYLSFEDKWINPYEILLSMNQTHCISLCNRKTFWRSTLARTITKPNEDPIY